MSIVVNPLQSLGPGSGGLPPSTPTLSIVDNGDDTGATATLADGDSDATHTVYTRRVDGEFNTGTWTSSGSRTGNGTVALSSLVAGYYWGYATAVSPDNGEVATAAQFFQVTTGADAVHFRCLEAAQAKVITLGLAGLADDSVIVRKFPIDQGLGADGVALPAVILSPRREREANTGGNDLDDIEYPVEVSILKADNQSVTSAIDTYTKWREQIYRAFRWQRLPGVNEVYTCKVEPGTSIVPSAWQNNLLASVLTLRFTSREVRGI